MTKPKQIEITAKTEEKFIHVKNIFWKLPDSIQKQINSGLYCHLTERIKFFGKIYDNNTPIYLPKNIINLQYIINDETTNYLIGFEIDNEFCNLELILCEFNVINFEFI